MTTTTEKLNLWGIALHGLIAGALGIVCGVLYAWGYPVTAFLAIALTVLFWPARELSQHDGEFRFHWRSQSMWEWIAPDIVSVVAMVATILIL